MLLTKEVTVNPSGTMIQYYKDKGYDVKCRQPLLVKIEDLQKNSHEKVDAVCDYCGRTVLDIAYRNYSDMIQSFGKYACDKCNIVHYEKAIMNKYGCKRPAQNKSILQKMKETMLEKYGVENPSQSVELLNKKKNTWLEKYGVDNPNKSPKIKEKAAQSYYIQSSQKCSKQQWYLFNLYSNEGKVELNYPVSYYNIDICFIDDGIAIEYDGSGHDLAVKCGNITKEEFDRRAIIRNRTLKNEGYKLIKIISTQDKLPSDEILFQMLSEAKQYFSDYPNHSWIEYNIDTSTVRNAERKDGVFFDYGELRKIK